MRALRLRDREERAQHGLTSAQMNVLHALGAADGISLNELSREIATDQSSASVVVQRLVASGLVSRMARMDDRRHVELRLTARGRAIARAAAPPAHQQIARALAGMSPVDRKKLARLLETFVDELSGGE